MANTAHILVVDDEAGIRDLLQRYFTGQGFTVSTAANGDAMRKALASQPIDLVLLDLGLPGEDGLTLTRELRAEWRGAVIIITGRSDEVDRIVGLELGADDYVAKPLNLRELLARARSVLRRVPAPAVLAAPERSTYHFDGFRLDPQARRLTTQDGRDLHLTTGEYELLYAFVTHANVVLSRDRLMAQLHQRDSGPYDRVIDVQVGRLRRKIESDPANPRLIKSIRGVGYLFAAQVHQ